MDDFDLPWPQEGDELFLAGQDWWHNACLNYLSDDWELYVNGYKQAADALVEHVKQTRGDQDTLVFPIVFLYRQYLELRLKQLIRDGCQLFDQSASFPKKHELDRLWAECRPILSKLESPVPTSDLEAVDEAIAQFCAVDPTSQAFRYPTDKEENPSLPADLRYINLRNLAEVMERIGSFFDAAAMVISVYLEQKREIEREYRDAFGFP
jgi:hypothetical protein